MLSPLTPIWLDSAQGGTSKHSAPSHESLEQFCVAGHDRGGRVAYRLALDHPAQVLRLATLDILPTYEHFHRADMQFGLGYWHWFFLAQPFDVPERVIGADTTGFFGRTWPL